MSQPVKSRGFASVVHLPSTLDPIHMIRMKPQLTRLLNRHPRLLVIDLTETRQVKLAGLGMLIDRIRRSRNGTGEIRFSNASPRVQETLVRAGVVSVG